jgi:hypothetical protein
MGEYGQQPDTNIAFAQGMTKGKMGSLYLSAFNDMIKEFAAANCPLYAVNTEGNRSLINN